MVTLVGTEREVRTLLADLIARDHDAIAAYDTAISGISDERYRSTLGPFREDHVRHTQNMAQFLVRPGGVVPQSADAKALLTTGKVAIGALLGDKAMLMAMRSNEDDTNTAYGRAVEHSGVTSEMRLVLEHHLADERRHRDWIDETVGSM
jgi:uncharacterized protein (TIGR02284 family)